MSYRMDGGAPAGIFMIPSESGDLIIRTNIRIMTRQGNKSTRPSGTDRDELPFRRILRPKKPNRGGDLSVRRDASSNDSTVFLDAGSLLARFCSKPMSVY